MKIAILTQPLINNYGGTLQNYALQKVLKRLGHNPITIDYAPKSSLVGYLLSCVKTIVYFFVPSRRRSFSSHPRRKQRNPQFEQFTSTHITTTKRVSKLQDNLVEKYGLDAFIVGSDQVWRPRYNPYIEDMFFRFLKSLDVKRLSYAASFGTDDWEFSEEQTENIRKIINKFAAVSVREESGVILCKERLGVVAIQVLDPTLLLDKTDYEELCNDVPVNAKPFILAYVLDLTPEKKAEILKIEKEYGLTVEYYAAEDKASLKVEEWVAKFRDASYVVTDSFHGTVFSIIFGKRFKCLQNKKRGSSRFETLLSIYNSGLIEKKKRESIDFLSMNLNLD